MNHKIKCPYCKHLLPLEFQDGDGVSAYGSFQILFQLREDSLSFVVPADKLREVLSAYDKAKVEASLEAAEAIFKPTDNKMNKKED